MSSTTTPINPTTFALAIENLPLSNLHLKAGELRNSIAHLQYSNTELQRWADDGDRDCAEAVRENEATIERMEERIVLCKREVEKRGFRWGESEVEEKMMGEEIGGNGIVDGMEEGALAVRAESGRGEIRDVSQGNGRGTGGSLSDEELARRLREQMEEAEDEDESGIHL
ncbi:MAG: hypothetical protein M1835_004544 [Candelina submexicana]|nr:MAG: hypothetical protein M1835_004544 [Candelina submexicana]